jgi:hypothetical protein
VSWFHFCNAPSKPPLLLLLPPLLSSPAALPDADACGMHRCCEFF